MKKIERIKPKLGRRIANAISCLKGEPWPRVITYEPVKLERRNILTFGRVKMTPLHIDEWVRVDWDEIHREEIAAELGKDLLRAGAIDITTEQVDRGLYDPRGGMVYRAKIYVAMPEKE